MTQTSLFKAWKLDSRASASCGLKDKWVSGWNQSWRDQNCQMVTPFFSVFFQQRASAVTTHCHFHIRSDPLTTRWGVKRETWCLCLWGGGSDGALFSGLRSCFFLLLSVGGESLLFDSAANAEKFLGLWWFLLFWILKKFCDRNLCLIIKMIRKFHQLSNKNTKKLFVSVSLLQTFY